MVNALGTPLVRVRRPALYWALLVCLVLLLIETVSAASMWILGRRAVVFWPLRIQQVDTYSAMRDPVLGWPSPTSFGGDTWDRSGARRLPSFPEVGTSCVSVYGDSFVFGAEVDDREVWTNQLSIVLGCRVANYGVNGYGPDQAFLRFRRNTGDESSITVLGLYSYDIVRSVNQLRNLIAPEDDVGLKPRFVLDSQGALQLVPIPTFRTDELETVMRYPERFLTHEFFLPGGASGIVRAEFPFALALARSVRSYKLVSAVRAELPYEAFYRRDHPSGALEVTVRISEAFAEDARRRNKKPLLILFPGESDLRRFARTGRWVYEPLVTRLRESGHQTVNLGPDLITFLEHRNPRELFLETHYNASGNAVIARTIAAVVSRMRQDEP